MDSTLVYIDKALGVFRNRLEDLSPALQAISILCLTSSLETKVFVTQNRCHCCPSELSR